MGISRRLEVVAGGTSLAQGSGAGSCWICCLGLGNSPAVPGHPGQRAWAWGRNVNTMSHGRRPERATSRLTMEEAGLAHHTLHGHQVEKAGLMAVF